MSSTTILLIEDSAAQALRFRLLLEREGHQVEVATDGREGWQCACIAAPQLILLDIDLPGLDGFQVLARLKRGRTTAAIPVMMLTNRDHVSHVERALAMGANDYMFKEDAVVQLCASVAQLLARPSTAAGAE